MAEQPTTPDLASILKTLSDLNQSNQQSIVQLAQRDYQLPLQHLQSTPHHHYYEPPQERQPQRCAEQWLESSQRTVQALRPSQARTPVKVVDPSTIVEWSAGLRCVMRTVAQHEQLLSEVRKMIKSQHEHEEQWFKGREDLIKRQAARVEGQKKLDSVLKGLGTSSQGKTNSTPLELSSELTTFDMKVHRAQLQMVREWSTKLRNLGVPFFGTSSDLVVPIGKEDGIDAVQGKIRESDLLELQRKMLGILQDMCKE